MGSTAALFILMAGVSAQGNSVAGHKAMEAYLKYTGIDKQLDAYAKNIEKQVPEEIKLYVGPSVALGQTIIDKKIIFKWTFP